jgi:putative transposase
MGTSPKTVYRALVLKYDLNRLEAAEKVSALLKVQEEFRRWATEWALSGGKEPMPERIPLRHFANWFIYAGSTFDWLRGVKKSGVEVKKMRPPLIFNVQLRLGKERDVGSGVLVDVQKREVRIRKWSGQRGNTIALPLGENAVKWIMERVREGGKLVMTAIWVGRSRRNQATKLYVALLFRRKVPPMETKRLLVIDLNALHNGISWAVVEEERIVTKGILRPDVSRITHLQKVATRLDSLCAEKDEICDKAMATNSRMWRLLRNWEDEASKKLVSLAIQYKAMIVVDIPKDRSIRALKKGNYSSRRKIMLNFGHLRKRLKGLAEWYGVQYREKRLYSTICPRCGGKMKVMTNRHVKCTCGFETHRDEVPFHWAMKLYKQLVSFSNPYFSTPGAVTVGATGF